jgi:hypothetical protein
VRSARSLLLAAALLLPGCYAVKYQTRRPRGGPQHVIGADFFFWGLVGSKDVDLDTLCPNGVHEWRNEASAVNGLVSVLTLGIYSPRTIVVDCAGGT